MIENIQGICTYPFQFTELKHEKKNIETFEYFVACSWLKHKAHPDSHCHSSDSGTGVVAAALSGPERAWTNRCDGCCHAEGTDSWNGAGSDCQGSGAYVRLREEKGKPTALSATSSWSLDCLVRCTLRLGVTKRIDSARSQRTD